jgi:hypothetical protein
MFDENTGEGQQRQITNSHKNKIKRDLAAGRFTPTPFYAGVVDQPVKMEKSKATITVDPNNPLNFLNGNHSATAMEELRSENPAMQRKVDNLPITCMVSLDSDKRQLDFCNLQKSLKMDGSHLMSLSISADLLDAKQAPFFKLAQEIARKLNSEDESPLNGLIRFSTSSNAPIPFKSIATNGSSDLCFSLFGSAKIVDNAGKDADWIAGIICDAYALIKNNNPELLNKGMLLCPPPDGTNGGASLLVGVGNLLAYRLFLMGHDDILPADEKAFNTAISEVFNEEIDRNMSNPRKRDSMRGFSDYLFEDIAENSEVVGFHCGVPVSLLVLLSTSTFNAEPLPKAPRQPKTKKVKTIKQVESNSPVVMEEVLTSKVDSDTDPEFSE